MVQVIAHRGASKYIPENTMAAFKKAHEFGCKYVECDVGLTKDNIPIIIHDDTLDRTTNGFGAISEHSFEYIKNLDAGSWKGPEFADLRIPLLQELLDWHAISQGWLNLEIKEVKKELIPFLIDTIFSEIQNSSYQENIILSSFQFEIMLALKSHTNFPRAFLSSYANDFAISQALKCQCMQISVSRRWLSKKFITSAHQQGLKVGVYTVNDKKEFLKFCEWGIDVVFTDDVLTISKV